jgi:hypothetical protein
MEYNDALKEVNDILKSKVKINLKSRIIEILNMYEDALKDFEYINNNDDLLLIKNKYIRYVEYNNKLNYGGFLVKSEKINNTIFIYLINTNKQIWKINANKNFIFCCDILTPSQKIRKSFEEFLLLKNK